jgi:hypothetical protein
MLYRDGAGNVAELPIGTPTQVLTVGGSGVPVWAAAGGGGGDPPRTITASDVAVVGDTVIFVDSTLGAVTLTLVAAASAVRPLLVIHTVPANDLTIDPPGAETIQGFSDVMLEGDGTIRSVNVISNLTAWFIG